jgi:hypothetical protein
VSHLRCPECRLTVPAAAYYLRGDQCPRCMTSMQPYARPQVGRRAANAAAAPLPVPRAEVPAGDLRTRPGG